jgi:Fur family peroxide stress response transcriptional regulator
MNRLDQQMSNSQRLLNLLRQAGYRITPQRRAICDYLARTEQHPTAYRVYEALSADHPDLSRATVYNTLNVLHELGALVQLDLGDEHTHYETNLAPHVNLICRRCRAVFDFTPLEPPTAFLDSLHATSGFQPTTVHVQVMGLCPDCQAKERI